MNTQTPAFHELSVQHVDKETPESIVISFAVPADLRDHYTFAPGQYLTLRATIDGQDVRRSYSICSATDSPRLSVGVKALHGGLFSNFAQQVKVGDQIQVMTPQGRFTAPLGGSHNYLLLAAGSGVTPMMSIAQSVLAQEPDSTVTLFYANRNTGSVMFRQSFNDLKDKYMTRFLLTHVMDEESQDVELFNGRLDAEKLNSLQTSGLIDTHAYDAIYICGPEPMINGVTSALNDLGVDAAKVKRELFAPSTPLRTAAQANALRVDLPCETVHAEVDVLIDGSTKRFSMQGDETLLEGAARAGLDIPYSCANGMCATCRCKLTKGDATMAQNFSLDPWEVDAGFVLACQLQPTSAAIELDFDAV